MTWFAFTNGHPDINAAGVEEKTLTGYGFHGYATQTQADAHRNSVNFLQQALLDTFDAEHAARVTAGAAGGSASDQATIAQNAAGGLGLHWPGADNFLWRAVKVMLGGILLLAGIVRLTGADQKALGVAQVVSKVPGA